MSARENDDDFQLERQWLFLEEHYINNKPIVARVLDATFGHMLVDVGGIQGYVEPFVWSVTIESPKNTSRETRQTIEEMDQSYMRERMQERIREKMERKDILLDIIDINKEKNHIKFSKRQYTNTEEKAEKFIIGSVHDGIVSSISRAFILIDLGGGMMGKLPSMQPAFDQKGFIRLSTMLCIGQEIKVLIVAKRRHALFLSLKDF